LEGPTARGFGGYIEELGVGVVLESVGLTAAAFEEEGHVGPSLLSALSADQYASTTPAATIKVHCMVVWNARWQRAIPVCLLLAVVDAPVHAGQSSQAEMQRQHGADAGRVVQWQRLTLW
jgi:hypothetical protein